MKTETLIILSPGFPINEADTTCLPLQQIFLRTLKQKYPGLNIIVIAFEFPYIKSVYQWHSIKVIAFAGRNKNRLPRLFNWVQVWYKLTQLKKQHHIIGMLSFWVDECAFIGHLFAKKNNLKHFSWVLGQDARPGNRYFKWIKPNDDELIALSDHLRKEVYKNYGIMPMHTITTGIDANLFGEANLVRDIDILGVGSLIPLKRYDLFINGVKSISVHLPHVKAMICGKGDEKDKLVALIKELHLEKNVLLQYELPHPEVLKLMQRTKVFLHPSSYEGFAAVIPEALYAGAQVISFVQPMDEVPKHHHIVNSINQMNAKLIELLKDEYPDNSPVFPYPIAQVAERMMQLFITRK